MKKLSNDDKKVWKMVAKTVTPLGEQKPAETGSVSVADGLAQILDFASYVPPKTLKKRRGHRVLDLHGMTQNEGHKQIELALCRATAQNVATLEIITGKGHGKGAGLGIFKRLVPLWLEVPPFSKMVKQWHWKPKNDGCLICYIK